MRKKREKKNPWATDNRAPDMVLPVRGDGDVVRYRRFTGVRVLGVPFGADAAPTFSPPSDTDVCPS